MIERIGKEQLLDMLLKGSPDRLVDAAVTLSAEDTADLIEMRSTLAEFALAAPVAAPKPALRARLLAARPRPLRPKRPILMVVDMIRDHLTPGLPLEVPRARMIVPALQKKLVEARAVSMPIIYVCDAHEEGDPDYEHGAWPRHALTGSEGAEVIPELAPEASDHIVHKLTYSAFTRTTLGPLLDELGADELVLTGCATEIGLAATAADALQRGFVVTMPPDCQAGVNQLAEMATLLTLSTMPPYDPRYLRKSA
jgi:nicotinamidase-related amidase